MDPLALLIKLVLLFVAMFIAERITRPPLSFILNKIARAAEEFAVVLGTQLRPAFAEAAVQLRLLSVELKKMGVVLDRHSKR